MTSQSQPILASNGQGEAEPSAPGRPRGRPMWYFGCGPENEAGHYLHKPNGTKVWATRGDADPDHFMQKLDGVLAPLSSRKGYVATFSTLGPLHRSALSWWDYSADSRGGCNSIVFADGMDWTAEGLLAEAQARMPWVFARLPQPIQLDTAFAPKADTSGRT
jgi:hypothetical protein